MNSIHGIYRDGHIELDSAVSWPDGFPVTVQPCLDEEPAGTRLPSIQLPDGTILLWSNTPEFRAALMAQMDRREPVELTPEEEAHWHADQQWIRAYTMEAVRREMGLES